jgi:hypothetical protein
MDQNEILEALNEISDAYILEAATPPRKKALTLRRGIAFAAAAAAVLALVLSIPFLNTDNEIVTAPGVITVKAYSEDPVDPIEITMQEGYVYEISNRWFSSYAPGTGFTLNAPQQDDTQLTVQITPSVGFLFSVQPAGRNYCRSLTVPNGSNISWCPVRLFTEHVEEDRAAAKDQSAVYLRLILLEDGNITGYAVVSILHSADNKDKLSLLQSVSFPKTDGKYQSITMKYVNAQMDATIENHR